MKGLASVYEDYANCTACELASTRNELVFGDGPEDADIMIIGTGPGKDEDAKGVPFVGDSGDILKLFAKDSGLKLKDTFRTNIVCCRPFIINPKGWKEDRDPTEPEIRACAPRLVETIRIVDPILIIALGRVAMISLTRKRMGIRQVHGEVFTTKIPGKTTELTYAIMPTLHPAYLGRNPDMGARGWYQKVLADFRRAVAISERYESIKTSE